MTPSIFFSHAWAGVRHLVDPWNLEFILPWKQRNELREWAAAPMVRHTGWRRPRSRGHTHRKNPAWWPLPGSWHCSPCQTNKMSREIAVPASFVYSCPLEPGALKRVDVYATPCIQEKIQKFHFSVKDSFYKLCSCGSMYEAVRSTAGVFLHRKSLF